MRSKALLILIWLAAMAPTVALAADCSSYEVRREMAQGKQLYQRAQFAEAIRHFKLAVDFDDDCISAKFALAGAYASEVVPGVETPENQGYAEEAIAQFRKILERDPQNTNALKDIGLLYMFVKRLDQPREYFKKAVAAAPNDSELLYLLGVTDWEIAYRGIANRKAELGLRVDDEFQNSQKGRQLCADVQAANQTLVDEGLAILRKAIDKRKDYRDAMAYTALLYQLKASMECDKQARSAYLRLSQKWMAERKELNQPETEEHSEAVDSGLETGTVWFMPIPPPPPMPPEKNRPR